LALITSRGPPAGACDGSGLNSAKPKMAMAVTVT
jgi:hypothetical protein